MAATSTPVLLSLEFYHLLHGCSDVVSIRLFGKFGTARCEVVKHAEAKVFHRGLAGNQQDWLRTQ